MTDHLTRAAELRKWSNKRDVDSYALATELADALESLAAAEAENERLRKALCIEREDNLWNAYYTGHVRPGGEWDHCCMSDGEGLARECGFDPRKRVYPDDEIRAAIPVAAQRYAARAALKEPTDAEV